jgi:hypothetical protein
MHGKRRYVKLALATLTAALLPSVARAEVVAPAVESALLAVGPRRTPTVSYLDERSLVVTKRTSAGWRPVRLRLPVPATEATVVAAAVGRDGRPAVLVEDFVRRTLVVVWRRPARWLVVRVARLSTRVDLGVGGLALDRRGLPVVAYAFRQASRKTFLRLARLDTRGRLRTAPITRLGFPDSVVPPSAAPVLTSGGAIRVVEAYTSAVIEWYRERDKWIGQYVFASARGSPLGRLLALRGPAGVVAAWTQEYPEFGETHVLVHQGRPTGDVADVLSHARLAAMTVALGVPEVAANDWVEIDGWTDFAAVVASTKGDTSPVELDGRVDGYAAVGTGRQLLLSTDRGLEWFGLPGRPSVRVSLTAAAGRAAGRVAGAASGAVEVYAESPTNGRRLVATAAVAGDGSFVCDVPAPTSPTLYRAVYRDPMSGVPYASLTRTPGG